MSPPTGWLSYDSVAETYDRVAVPWFGAIARDLVAAVAMPQGASVLDVGTGTGLTAELARLAVGSRGIVVGVDPSTAMLALARSRRRILPARAMAPGLPFRSASFDAVVANLVLSHVPDVTHGLADMVSVLRPGGRIGVTAWAPDPEDAEDQGREADGIVASVRDACGLASMAPATDTPWGEALRDRQQLCDALAGASIVQVETRLRTYRHAFPIEHYLSGWGTLGRYLRHEAGQQRWQAFTDAAAAKLRERFGDKIVSVKQVRIATGAVASIRLR